MFVGKDLTNHQTDVNLLHTEAPYRSWDGLRLLYFYKKVWVWLKTIYLPFIFFKSRAHRYQGQNH